jgi:hypothetical protein
MVPLAICDAFSIFEQVPLLGTMEGFILHLTPWKNFGTTDKNYYLKIILHFKSRKQEGQKTVYRIDF